MSNLNYNIIHLINSYSMAYNQTLKIIFLLTILFIPLKSIADKIPIYLKASLDCYDLLSDAKINIIKKRVGADDNEYLIFEKDEYLITDRCGTLCKKISEIDYYQDYSTDSNEHEYIEFKVKNANKSVILEFDKFKKHLLLNNKKKKFNFILKEYKVEGLIKNETDRILINLICTP